MTRRRIALFRVECYTAFARADFSLTATMLRICTTAHIRWMAGAKESWQRRAAMRQPLEYIRIKKKELTHAGNVFTAPHRGKHERRRQAVAARRICARFDPAQ